jgi:hypothetical protein
MDHRGRKRKLPERWAYWQEATHHGSFSAMPPARYDFFSYSILRPIWS